MTDRRYYVRSPDGGMVAGYDDANAARAVAGGKAEIVELPIAHGADANARDGAAE